MCYPFATPPTGTLDLASLRTYRLTPGPPDLALRNRLVLENMGIVYRVVYQFTKRKRLNPDLVTAGVCGLIGAIDAFDVSKQVDNCSNLFFVFARWRILHEVQCAAANDSGMSKRMNAAGFERRDLQEILMDRIYASKPKATAWPYGEMKTLQDDPSVVPTVPPPIEQCPGLATRCDARRDLAVALRDATPDDVAVLVALAEGSDLCEALGMPGGSRHRKIAEERAAGALERARTALGIAC